MQPIGLYLQRDCPVVTHCIWIKQDGGRSIQAALCEQHVLLLEARVEVVVVAVCARWQMGISEGSVIFL